MILYTTIQPVVHTYTLLRKTNHVTHLGFNWVSRKCILDVLVPEGTFERRWIGFKDHRWDTGRRGDEVHVELEILLFNCCD